jgi:parallel beta-helix repeat protein
MGHLPRTFHFRWSAVAIVLAMMAALVPLAATTPAAAATYTYYVDNTDSGCSDAGPGSIAQPFCTIGKAASLLTAGESVHVVAGTYAETVNGPNSGTAGNPITYSAAPGVTVTGNGTASGNAFRMTSKSYIVIDGFTITDTVDYGIYASGSNHITISNDHVSSAGSPVSGSTRMGIYFTNTDDSTITGNTTDHNSQDGIRLTGGSSGNLVSDNVSYANAEEWERNATGIQVTGTGSDNNTIIHNITYANEDSGLQFYAGAKSNLVIGNLSYGNGDHGIDNNNAPNNTFVGNTVQGNVTAGINLEGTTGSGGATLANNISVDNGLRLQVGGGTASGQPTNIRVDAASVTGTTIDYDEVYLSSGTGMIQWNGTTYASLALFQAAVPGQETHGLEADPLFASPAPIAQRPAAAPFNVAVNSGDYHLTAGSPAIDSADSNASNEPSLDIEGHARVDDPATTDTGAGVRTYDDRGAYEYVPSAANNAPVLNPIGNQNAQVGTQLAFTATASDADNDPLTFSLDDGTSGQVPAGASITSGGDFAWTPTSGQQGTATFDVCVTDSIAAPVCETISVTVSSGSLPTITSFTPTSGLVGTLVKVFGTNFTPSSTVSFNGTAGTGFIWVSATRVKAKVPVGASTGPISVDNGSGVGTSTADFTVSSGSPPTITSFTPTSGPVGTLVTITGTNFSGATVVKFGGVIATFNFVSDTEITATVPGGATTGKILVKTPAGKATSLTKFTVT